MVDKLLLLANVASTWAMVGVIWFVQIVHYPLFDRVGESAFQRYELDHQRLTTFVVAPLMLIEAICAVVLVLNRPAYLSPALVWTSGFCLALVWLSTFFIQVPLHESLGKRGLDVGLVARLVNGNWIRTFLWTCRGAISLVMIARSWK